MRLVLRWIRRLGLAVAALLLLVALLVGLGLAAANTAPGRRALAGLVGRISGGAVAVQGLGGRFPDRLRLAGLELRAGGKVWLRAADLALDWRPLGLLHGNLEVARLSAGRVALLQPPPQAASGGSAPGITLPVLPVARLAIDRLAIRQLDLAASVAGQAARLRVDGSARMAGSTATLNLAIARQDAPGNLTARLTLGDGRLVARVAGADPGGVLLGHLTGLPGLGATRLSLDAAGPLGAVVVRADLGAGDLALHLAGTLDVPARRGDLTVRASGAATPLPGVGWKTLALVLHATGPLDHPDLRGTLDFGGLAAGGVLADAALTLDGGAPATPGGPGVPATPGGSGLPATPGGSALPARPGGSTLPAKPAGNAAPSTPGGPMIPATPEAMLRLTGTLHLRHLPGPAPDLLAARPMRVEATWQPWAPRPVLHLRLTHDLGIIAASLHPDGAASAEIALPDLAPLATAFGVDLAGRADINAALAPGTGPRHLTLSANIAASGAGPLARLLGPKARLTGAATLAEGALRDVQANLVGAGLDGSARIGLAGDKLAGTAQAHLADLGLLAPGWRGPVIAQADLSGTLAQAKLAATLTGEIAAPGQKPGQMTLHLHASGLPDAPQAQLRAEGTLAGAPLTLAAAIGRTAGGATTLTLDQLKWASLDGSAALTLPAGTLLPQGRLTLSMTRLADLAPLLGPALGRGLAGSAHLVLTQPDAGATKFTLEATNLRAPGLAPGMALAGLKASGALTGLTTHPDLQLQAEARGLAADGLAGTLALRAAGPPSATNLTLNAALADAAGRPIRLDGAALLDAPARRLTLRGLQGSVRGQAVRLLAPARLDFGAGLTVDRLQLAAAGLRLDLAGRLSPTLAARASLAGPIGAALAAAAPDWKNSAGRIDLTATLAGTLAQPRGRVSLTATGLTLPPQGNLGGLLPPARVEASADLAAGMAQLRATATAGASNLHISGSLPLGPRGALGLRARGVVDLALINPLLAAQGRNLAGHASLEATARGTLAAPDLAGTLTLAGGSFQDFVHGVRVRDVTATIQAQGTQLWILKAGGHAGDGTLGLAGTLDLTAGLPVDLTLTAHKAQLLSSDQSQVALDADLTLRGTLRQAARLAGSVRIDSATLRMPQAMPPATPNITIRRPGTAPPPPASPPWPIALDVTIAAPNPVFVRGRGLDAVVTGKMRLAGTLAQPQSIGGLTLQRGSYSLAGTTLQFTSGTVSFGGGAIEDPAINFVASSATTGLTAMLRITGTVARPKLVLTSTPSLPPDEVLAQLLFGRSVSQLGPLQMAQMAQGLAALGGVSSDLLDPLALVRRTLGLDQLSVGNSITTGSPTLQAGRYVAPGIYVGAKQGLSAGTGTAGTQATVQIDIGHGLKLEGDVGTGAGDNAAGVTYEIEY